MASIDVDLFAGPGGWDMGARALGRDPVGVENEPTACRTARGAKFERQYLDVSATDPRAFLAGWADGADGLLASPPCQGFSIAGKGRSRDDSAALLAGLARVRNPKDLDRLRSELLPHMTDARTLLALEPLRWALALMPRWCAWEQVPGVRPLWEACAVILRSLGYSVAVGMLTAEAFGVPQTRNRAFLVARWDQPANLPTPTHSRFYPRNPERLDAGVKPWVSMADALGWDSGDLVGFPRRGQERDDGALFRVRDLYTTLGPAPVVTSKARSWRRATEPEWQDRFNDQSGTDFDAWWPARRPATAVAGRSLVQNPGATANRFNGSTKSRNDGLRVTASEAGVLQSFPPDYPWHGVHTAKFQQIGDAVPPLVATAVISAITGQEGMQ